jgi:hypothetical protein
MKCGLTKATNQWECDFQLQEVTDLIENYLFSGFFLFKIL